MSAYAPFQLLTTPARETAQIWRIGLAIVMIAAGFVVFNGVFFAVLSARTDWPEVSDALMFGNSPAGVWLMLLNFAGLLISLGVATVLLHGRGVFSLLGPLRPALVDFGRAVRVLIILYAVIFLIPSPEGSDLMRNIGLSTWVSLLPLSLALILLQIATEELVFRGYLQSYLGARFRSPLVWMVLPSAMFAVLHLDFQTYGSNAVAVALWAGVFGLAAADLTARTGSLGAAMGLHLVNNVSAMLITGLQGYWDGLTLFVLPFGPHNEDAVAAMLPLEALMILCSWLAVRIAVKR